jgi:hypothetical protein
MHSIRILLDGVRDGTSGARLSLFADEFLDKIMGEGPNALQIRNQRAV